MPHVYWAVGGGVGFSALKPSATAHEDWEAINAVASVILLIPVASASSCRAPHRTGEQEALLLAACLAGASIAVSHGVFGIVYRVLNLIGSRRHRRRQPPPDQPVTSTRGGPEGGDRHGQEHWQGPPHGAVKGRSEFKHPNGTFVKRDTKTGRILNVSAKPHKGVRDE